MIILLRNFLLVMLLAFPFANIKAQSIQEQANDISKKADDNRFYENYITAESEYLKASNLYLSVNDSLNWLKNYISYGEILLRQDKVKEGHSVLLYSDSIVTMTADLTLLSQMQDAFGEYSFAIYDYNGALDYFLKALEYGKQASDTTAVIEALNGMVGAYRFLDNAVSSIESGRRAIFLARKMNSKRHLISYYSNIYSSFLDTNEYDSAEVYVKKAITLAIDVGARMSLGNDYKNLGELYNRLGNDQKALIYYLKSYDILKEKPDYFEYNRLLFRIGELYYESRDYEAALRYYHEIQQFYIRKNNIYQLGNSSSSIAAVYRDKRDYEKARFYYQQALDLISGSNTIEESRVLIEYAYFNILDDRYEDAKEKLDLLIERKKPKRNTNDLQLSYILSLRGLLARLEGDLPEMLRYSRLASTNYQPKIPYLDVTLYMEMGLSRAFYSLDSDSAIVIAHAALNDIRDQSTGAVGYELEGGNNIDLVTNYNELAGWYLNLRNDVETAYELIENGKTRFLKKTLSESHKNDLQQLDSLSLQTKREAEEEITKLFRELGTAERDSRKDSLRKHIREKEFELEAFMNELAEGNPELTVSYDTKPIPIAQVQAGLTKETAVLEYAFSEFGLVTFLITKDNVQWRVLDGKLKNSVQHRYEDLIYEYRSVINRRASIDSLRLLSAPLLEAAFQGLLEEQPEITQLIIIPDGPLAYLPFDALLDEEGKFLLEQYNIKTVPSASIIPLIEQPGRIKKSTLFAFAASEFGEEGSIPLLRSEAFTPLPFAPIEVDSISALFSGATVLKGGIDSEEIIKKDGLDTYKFLHFATHAVVDEANSSQSRLILSNENYLMEEKEDGHLTSLEINNFIINADMVVLSACNSGTGKYLQGEGLLGLQRSFLVAGASSVVASLWEVYDESTSLFMMDFYNKLLEREKREYGWWEKGLNFFGQYEQPVFDYKAKALRDAKLDMLEHPYYNHPVYWAPFVYVGN